jgi:hypothetical protein
VLYVDAEELARQELQKQQQQQEAAAGKRTPH